MKTLLAAVGLFVSFVVSPAYAQTFSSGSTGADGALDLSTSCPGPPNGNYCVLQLPPSGVLNFTTINIPGGYVLAFRRNLANTPVTMLAQGDVTITGSVIVSAGSAQNFAGAGDRDGAPGPGGFYGGLPGSSGLGPGGGVYSTGNSDPNWHGSWVGPLSLVPIIGGSGGSGGSPWYGGGGGGAIVIASSTKITITSNGSIAADGAPNIQNINGTFYTGAGSGGAIRLVSNAIEARGHLSAAGGRSYRQGMIRLEAPSAALSFNGSAGPAAVLSLINPTIVPAATPTLAILSVGGYPVPSYAGHRYDAVDLILPMQLPDPINVIVSASNIPLGTQVGLSFGTSNGGTVTPGTLNGSLASSTATIQVSGLNRAALAYLFVSATFGVASGAAPMNPPGPDQVAQVRVTAAPGVAPQFSFQRADGSTIDSRLLPADLLKQFRP